MDGITAIICLIWGIVFALAGASSIEYGDWFSVICYDLGALVFLTVFFIIVI